jgi:hypothetical protein
VDIVYGYAEQFGGLECNIGILTLFTYPDNVEARVREDSFKHSPSKERKRSNAHSMDSAIMESEGNSNVEYVEGSVEEKEEKKEEKKDKYRRVYDRVNASVFIGITRCMSQLVFVVSRIHIINIMMAIFRPSHMIVLVCYICKHIGF